MNDSQARRILAITGLLIGLGVLGSVPLYFVYSGPPPASNVLTRGLITLIMCALMIGFFSTFSHLIRRADPGAAWLGSIVQSAGTLFVGIALLDLHHNAQLRTAKLRKMHARRHVAYSKPPARRRLRFLFHPAPNRSPQPSLAPFRPHQFGRRWWL